MKKPLIALAAVAAMATTAQAKVMHRAVVDNWQVSAWSMENNPAAFSHCAAVSTQPQSGGVYLLFAFSEEMWSVGMYDTRWQLNPWQIYDITLSIDNSAPINVKGAAASEHQVRVSLPKTDDFVEQMKHGQVLHVTATSKQFNFRLRSVEKMLPVLLACVNSEANWGGGTNDPFAPTSLRSMNKDEQRF